MGFYITKHGKLLVTIFQVCVIMAMWGIKWMKMKKHGSGSFGPVYQGKSNEKEKKS